MLAADLVNEGEKLTLKVMTCWVSKPVLLSTCGGWCGTASPRRPATPTSEQSAQSRGCFARDDVRWLCRGLLLSAKYANRSSKFSARARGQRQSPQQSKRRE